MSMEVREKMDMERLVQLAEEKQYRQLKEALLEFPAVDVAAFMEELDSERTVVVRHYVRDFYIRDRAMRDFMFSQNRLTYIMLFICYLSPALAECVSSLRRVFQRK